MIGEIVQAPDINLETNNVAGVIVNFALLLESGGLYNGLGGFQAGVRPITIDIKELHEQWQPNLVCVVAFSQSCLWVEHILAILDGVENSIVHFQLSIL